jgi:hypothetical protein
VPSFAPTGVAEREDTTGAGDAILGMQLSVLLVAVRARLNTCNVGYGVETKYLLWIEDVCFIG